MVDGSPEIGGVTTRKRKHAFVERLMHYYHFISERFVEEDSATVTSDEVAKLVHMDATVVRKDLAAIGVRGMPRVGFRAGDVLAAISELLGFNESCKAILVGVGRLGSAMASYHGFAPYGLEICGLFDSDPTKVGLIGGGKVVLHVRRIASVVQKHDVRLAILTVPREAAQEMADCVVEAGVKAIWNFASTSISVPEGVVVRHEHISVGFAELRYLLKHPDLPAEDLL